MATFDKQKVDIASSNHSKLDVSSTHITTGSWMALQPVYYRHMMPKEHLSGQGNVLSRLAPVAVPTYGRCRINLRTFFVPFRTIFPNFNEFITDTIGTNVSGSSLVAGSPILPNYELVKLFTTSYSMFGQDLATPYTGTGDFDFQVGTTKYRLGFYGRHMMKVLQSLGYRVLWADKDPANHDLIYSALPLMAYAKVYCDWYFNQAYLDASYYLAIQQLFKFNDPSSQLSLTAADVFNILNVCFATFYDNGNDVYINSWDNPNAPNNNLYSSFTGADVSAMSISGSPMANTGFSVVLDANGTPYMKQSGASSTSIGTEYLHQFLKSATDYVKRNQLSGALQIDRFLARFGISLDSAKVNRSVYVSSQSIDVDFGTVMSNANTSTTDVSNLGDYAGQGIGRGQLNFDFQTDEFGLFIITSSIVPAASLYQGFDRNNLHIDKLDFFTPEFDNLGVQAVTKGEVYVANNTNFSPWPENYGHIWGFAPRYYEYKQAKDFVTGDFVCSNFDGGDSWHLARILNDASFSNDINYQHHSLDFTRGLSDVGQYNRIFNYTEGDIDQFYLVYHFAAQSLSPCKSLFDTYDFDDAGNAITMNGNNAKVN